MKHIITFLLLTGVANNLHAQQKLKIIRRDTINLRGYVYDDQGKPVKYINIKSTQLDVEYNEFNVNSTTDSAGYFELKGAKFNDTLTFQGHAVYETPAIYNRDSRYLIIYLPPKVQDINSSSPVEISHARTTPKIMPTFSTWQYDGDPHWSEVHRPPRYPHKEVSFTDYIKNNLKYPDDAVKNNAEGTVEIEFTVGQDGRPVNFKVLRGIGYGCEQELINVLKKSPWWEPAIDNGRPFAMRQTVSVKFSLTDK